MSLVNTLLVRSLPFVPKSLVGAVSKRYIAGETLEEALEVATGLNRRGFFTTVDMLGEDTTDIGQARRAASDYQEVLQAVGRNGIEGNISVKPTQFGLKLDPKLCADLFRGLIEEARSLGYFVRVEMEDSTCTESTVDLYRALLAEYDNVGIVFQSYLHRTETDVETLARFSPNVRMVKGVYVEPAAIAYQGHETVRKQFLALSETLFRAGSYVAFATHDEGLVDDACLLVDRLGLPTTAYEFQMLLGVAEGLREKILESGRRMRVYVPFGRDWYAYSLRRFRENPKIAGYVLRSMLPGG